MDARMLAGLTAVLSGFACAFSLTFWVGQAIRKRQASITAQGGNVSARAIVFWRLRNGYALLRAPAARLLRINKVADAMRSLANLLGARGVVTQPESLASVVLGAFLLVAVASASITGSVVGAVAVPVCVAAVVVVIVGNREDRRREAIREAVPGALESMAACFGSGFTLLQTFKQVAGDIPDPLASTFASSANVLEMGGSAEAALKELREGAHASELAFVAVALDVQHQSGGAMKQVLDAATETVRGELALRRSLRVQTAQAKLSARVVAIMPFILVAAFSLASPDFLAPFFSSPSGYALLALALIMQVSGIVLVRRALEVDGVS